MGLGARGRGEGLGEAQRNPNQVHETQDEGDERWNGEGVYSEAGEVRVIVEEIDVGGEGADRRTGDEAEAEGGADEAHGFGALGARGDVGDRCGGDGEVAAKRPADEPREEKHPERAAEHPHEIAEGGAGDGPAEYTAAAEAVTEPAPKRCEDELEDGKNRADDATEQDGGEITVFAQCTGDGVELGQEPAEDAAMTLEAEVVGEEVRPEREDD